MYVGHRLLAFAELWNYTGNYCFPKYGPLPISDDNAGFQVRRPSCQDFCFVFLCASDLIRVLHSLVP